MCNPLLCRCLCLILRTTTCDIACRDGYDKQGYDKFGYDKDGHSKHGGKYVVQHPHCMHFFFRRQLCVPGGRGLGGGVCSMTGVFTLPNGRCPTCSTWLVSGVKSINCRASSWCKLCSVATLRHDPNMVCFVACFQAKCPNINCGGSTACSRQVCLKLHSRRHLHIPLLRTAQPDHNSKHSAIHTPCIVFPTAALSAVALDQPLVGQRVVRVSAPC